MAMGGLSAARRRARAQALDLECRMPRLVCPRISPEWELAAQLALVKPKPYTKDKIAHRDPQQVWPRNARKVVADCLDPSIAVNFPKSGDRLTVDFGEMEFARAKRLA